MTPLGKVVQSQSEGCKGRLFTEETDKTEIHSVMSAKSTGIPLVSFNKLSQLHNLLNPLKISIQI